MAEGASGGRRPAGALLIRPCAWELQEGRAGFLEGVTSDGPPRPLQCVNELNQWLSALRKVSISNPGLLGSYHPGVFRGDKWSCCHQKDKSGGSGGLGPPTRHLSTLAGLAGGRLCTRGKASVPVGAPGGKGSVTAV